MLRRRACDAAEEGMRCCGGGHAMLLSTSLRRVFCGARRSTSITLTLTLTLTSIRHTEAERSFAQNDFLPFQSHPEGAVGHPEGAHPEGAGGR